MDRAAWIAGKFGTFHHFLTAAETSPSAWNAQVDSFAVDLLADQLAEAGVDWHVLTVGQNSGHYCAPNSAYAELTGRGALLSQRDLIADLAGALTRRGIRLLVYSTTMAPNRDGQAMERLGCTPPEDLARILGLDPAVYRIQSGCADLARFRANWEAVHRTWSTTWDASIHGWWIDGCYARTLFQGAELNFASFGAALRTGNPAAIACWNPGVNSQVRPCGSDDDYTAGEWDTGMPVLVDQPWCNRPGRLVDGIQAHTLGFLGSWWGAGAPRFPDTMIAGWTGVMARSGWATTLDLPIDPRHGISTDYRRQLAAIRHAVTGARTA